MTTEKELLIEAKRIIQMMKGAVDHGTGCATFSLIQVCCYDWLVRLCFYQEQTKPSCPPGMRPPPMEPRADEGYTAPGLRERVGKLEAEIRRLEYRLNCLECPAINQKNA